MQENATLGLSLLKELPVTLAPRRCQIVHVQEQGAGDETDCYVAWVATVKEYSPYLLM